MQEPRPGTPDIEQILRLHGYTVISQIGEGGFGSVATVSSDKYPDVTFVAKFMKIPGDKNEMESFDHEITVLRSVCHPNIVQMYDHFEENGIFVLILEYCDGGSLDSYLRRNTLPHRRLVAIFKEILCGLSALHSMGIAHRDLKPRNILIDKYGRAKLADFGLSCFVKNGGPKWAGSLCFMAPEVLNLENGVNLFKADIWSLGITFFVCATGRKPWEASQSPALMRKVISNGVQQYPASMNREMRQFLMHILYVDPVQRPSCESLLSHPFFRPAASGVYAGIAPKLHGSSSAIRPTLNSKFLLKRMRKRVWSLTGESQATFAENDC